MHPQEEAERTERTAYYRRQASACATAALTTAIAEIKEAYLDLEQGWLCLAPKAVRVDQVDPGPGSNAELKTPEAPKQGADSSAMRQGGTKVQSKYDHPTHVAGSQK
jgi:hypothetical protein